MPLRRRFLLRRARLVSIALLGFASSPAAGQATRKLATAPLRWPTCRAGEANLLRVIEPSAQSVVVLVGNGHVRPLKHLLEEMPGFCPVSAAAYLREGMITAPLRLA